jgi:hypothetical protein
MFGAAKKNAKLIGAVKNGDIELVKRMIEKKGADIDARTAEGNLSTLMLAIRDKHEIVALYLIAHECDVNATSLYGETALHWAAANGKMHAVVSALIKKGADIDAKSHEGDTALTIAASNDHERTVRVLISSGADAAIRNAAGFTAHEIASRKGLKITAETIRSLTIETNTANGWTQTGKETARRDSLLEPGVTMQEYLDFGRETYITMIDDHGKISHNVAHFNQVAQSVLNEARESLPQLPAPSRLKALPKPAGLI